MSPNGLRRWRRYAKKCRYRSRKEGTRATGATAHGATARALFWKARNHPNFALPPKPFTPRSLVGMTQGARKRKAWRDVFYKDGRAITESLNASQEMLLSVYNSELAKYRIGQKLRPCAGCEECRGYDDGIGIIHCDGSGVLPARKSK